MLRFKVILTLIILSGCIAKSRDEIIDFEGVSPDKGIEYLNNIEKRASNNPDVYYKRASLYFEIGKYDQALADITKSLEIEEANADYVYLGGKINQRLGLSEKAIEQLLLAEGLGLHNNLLYQILAEEYLKLGKPEEAKLAIERLIGLNKNSTNYALAGQIALNLSDTVLAEQYYQKSINKEPNIPSLSALSKIYSNKGDMELAGDYINKALEIAPDQIPNLYQKAKILGSLTLVDSAKNIYQHIIILDSSQSEFHYELAEIYYEQYKYDSAKVFVEKSLRLNASDISAQLLRARIQNRMTDYEESISSYKAILAQDSTYNLAQLELDNLQRKVAYLRRLDQERRALDSARRNAPALIDRKGIDN